LVELDRNHDDVISSTSAADIAAAIERALRQ
jgi:hypothetical protein